MIRINQLKLDVGHSTEALTRAIEKRLHIAAGTYTYVVRRKSLDCRPKHPLKQVYTVDVELARPALEQNCVQRVTNKKVTSTSSVSLVHPPVYSPYVNDRVSLKERPIVIGAGPAGLFCSYLLARNGYRPLLLERGEPIAKRSQTVQAFWDGTAQLAPDSNVQFGEGGAGTFSDGKLNTVLRDKTGIQRFILQTFVECGAPEEILVLANPHIGTDYLKKTIENLRLRIQQLGGEVRFGARVDSFQLRRRADHTPVLEEVVLHTGECLPAHRVVLAIGHSARDTFETLCRQAVVMQPKPFAVGVRIEHPREQINALQYREHAGMAGLPTANYKLTHRAANGRDVFTFCMCPGGYVVNASSEQGGMVVNGMSNHDRMADNSNAAIVVSVTPKDFLTTEPLSGMLFQRQLESAAFASGQGAVPVQLFGDFCQKQISSGYGGVKPCVKGRVQFGNVAECLPDSISSAIMEAVLRWDEKLPGYARKDALILGVESRTSSPVRIVRDETMQSSVRGLYPCGEGAGYAGGIMSAAIDGCRVAEAIMTIPKVD